MLPAHAQFDEPEHFCPERTTAVYAALEIGADYGESVFYGGLRYLPILREFMGNR